MHTLVDDQYKSEPFQRFFESHKIVFKPRPTRRHNKTGTVEQKITILKIIRDEFDSEISTARAEQILARGRFLSNLFSGSRLLSAFQLVRGYQPSILGLPVNFVGKDLLQAHKELVSTRALQKVIKSRRGQPYNAEIFTKGDPIWVWVKSRNERFKDKWVKASVEEASIRHINARRSIRGPPKRVAYEDVRIRPRSRLTKQLLSCSVEEEFTYLNHDSEGHPPQHTALTK